MSTIFAVVMAGQERCAVDQVALRVERFTVTYTTPGGVRTEAERMTTAVRRADCYHGPSRRESTEVVLVETRELRSLWR